MKQKSFKICNLLYGKAAVAQHYLTNLDVDIGPNQSNIAWMSKNIAFERYIESNNVGKIKCEQHESKIYIQLSKKTNNLNPICTFSFQ